MIFKQFLIKSLAKIFRLFSRGREFFSRRANFFKKGFFWFGRFLFHGFIFPPYKLVYLLKYKILNIYAPTKSKLFYFLNKTYVVHALIIIISLTVAYSNIAASSTVDDAPGEKTIVYSIVSKEEYEELLEEMPIEAGQGQVLSYLEDGTAVGSQKVLGDTTGIEDRLITDLSMLAEGGIAVVKPNIIQPIRPEEVEQFENTVPTRYAITQYAVQAGDNLSSIAKKFNVSIETILWRNGLTINSFLKPGQTLEILPVTGVAHKVKSGESVSAIAKKYAVDAEKIVAFNNLVDVSDIKIGQELIVPGGKMIIPSRQATVAKAVNVAPISKLLSSAPPKETGTTLLWPTAAKHITQYYSWRHTGLDVGGPTGTPLYASDPGVVELSGWTNGYGNNIVINHQNGTKTRYAHASKLYVSKGDSVTRGQTIAAMGSTGWSTGPHIHYEVIVNGVKKNPLSYIK